MLRLRLAALALLAFACTPHDTTNASAKAWSVAGGAIRDSSGRAVILRGVNLASAQKAAPHLADFGAADYARIGDAFGFDVLRFVVTWSAIEPQKGVYDAAYLDALEQRMTWAHDAGLLVVLDMHQDLFGDGFTGGDGAPKWTCDASHYAAFEPKDPWFFGYLDPNVMACVDAMYEPGGELRAHFIDAWKTIAARLAKFDNVIGFDILNEPPWGSYSINAFEEEKLAPFYVEVATAVRGIAPGWLVFAEPGVSRNIGYASNLPKLPLDDVVYAPHSYDANAEQGQAFDGAHRDAVLAFEMALRGEADAMGAALFVGEYGGVTSNAGIGAYMQAEIDGAGAVGAGSSYWSYDKDTAGYGLLDDDGSEKTDLANVLAIPYPSRIAGDAPTYAFDPIARVATIRFSPNPAITTPTEIVVPKRVYANGFDVDCGGCTVVIDGATVRVMTPPPGNPATITVRPR